VDHEISPDVLMSDFREQKVLFLVVTTILVHVVLVFGSSYGFVWKKLFGPNTAEMSKEDRVKEAMGEATSSLGEVAKRHNLKIDDLTDRFAGSGSRASRIQAGGETGKTQDTTPPQAKDGKEPEKKEQRKEEPEKKEPERNLSELEKNFPKAKPGPAAPTADSKDTTGLP